ncbi:MAG: DUF1570 domain-containing protein [Planctomycetota bacterium]
MRLLLIFALCAGPLFADTLIFADGRIVDHDKVEATEEGYKLTYEHGEIVVPKAILRGFFKAGETPEFTPTTLKEKEQAGKNRYPWKGRWISKSYWRKLAQREIDKKKEMVEQAKARHFWRDRAKVKTKTFDYEHTLPDEIFEEWQKLFETYYKFFTKYWKIKPSTKFGKPRIHIYRDREYFYQVTGRPRGVAGFYVLPMRTLHFYYDRRRVGLTISIMFHEGNHMLSHMVDRKFRYPWWIGEGMAEYFGASKYDPETETMEIGLLQSGRLANLWIRIQEDGWLKLRTLIESGRSLGVAGYAWSWSFCHFLLSNEKYEKRFKKYFLALARSGSIKRTRAGPGMETVSSDEQIKALLRMLKVKNLKTLEAEWHAYIKRELRLDRKDMNWSEAGHVMDVLGENPQARKFFKRAIDAGVADAQVHYRYSWLKLVQNKNKTAHKYLEKTLELDPMHSQAISLLGWVKHGLGDKEEGYRLMKLAFEIDPLDHQVWFNLEKAKIKDEDAAGG